MNVSIRVRTWVQTVKVEVMEVEWYQCKVDCARKEVVVVAREDGDEPNCQWLTGVDLAEMEREGYHIVWSMVQ